MTSLFEWLERSFDLIPNATIEEVNALHDAWALEDRSHLTSHTWTSSIEEVVERAASNCARYCLRISREFGADVPHWEDFEAHFMPLSDSFFYSERISLQLVGPVQADADKIQAIQEELVRPGDKGDRILSELFQPSTLGHLLVSSTMLDEKIWLAEPAPLQARVEDVLGRNLDMKFGMDIQLTGFIYPGRIIAMAIPVASVACSSPGNLGLNVGMP